MHIYMMHIHMLLDHVCTMHIHMLLDNDAYVHDAYICDIQSLSMLHVCMMRLKFCDQPTNQQGDSRSRISLLLLHPTHSVGPTLLLHSQNIPPTFYCIHIISFPAPCLLGGHCAHCGHDGQGCHWPIVVLSL